MFDFGNFGDMFNGMFKPVGKDCCKLAINGDIAIKTSTGYKTFNIAKNKLVNCTNFAFNMDNIFWVVPTFKVEKGDIILVNGKPRAVIEVKKNTIKTFCYEDSTITEIVPEHHVFMGRTYCYGKIFCLFTNMAKGAGMNDFMKMIMMNQMFNNGNTNNMNNFNNFMPMMMFMGKGNNLFDNMFDGAFEFETDDVNEEDDIPEIVLVEE